MEAQTKGKLSTKSQGKLRKKREMSSKEGNNKQQGQKRIKGKGFWFKLIKMHSNTRNTYYEMVHPEDGYDQDTESLVQVFQFWRLNA